MAKARKTFHLILKIIHRHMYRNYDEDIINEIEFLKFFEQDILKEKPKTYSYKDYYFITNKSDNYRKKIMDGENNFPIKVAKLYDSHLDKTGKKISDRINIINEWKDDIPLMISEFERNGIPIDSNNITNSLIMVIREYLGAIIANRNDPYGIDSTDSQTDKSKCYYSNGILHMNGKTFDIAEITENNYEAVPDSKHEQEILKAFNAESEDQLNIMDKEFMTLQRIAYTTAECNRNNLRDCIEDGEPIYQKLIEEIKKGIKPTYMNSDYASGRHRMREVLRQSTNLAITNTLRDTPASDSDNRQGICHILIDEDNYFKKGWNL